MTSEQPQTHPIVVIGAGAAGLVAAIFAARGARPVLLLERTRDGGRKILISGGGRCNVLPAAVEPHRFVTDSSRNTLRNILRAWPLDDQRRFFEREVGVPLTLETETGKLFPVSNKARDVRDGLVALAIRSGVSIRFGITVTGLEPPSDSSPWRVGLEQGGTIEASAVVLATGGLSVPNTGSDGIGLALARRLGHTIHPTYPALTPLTADPPRHAELAGISPVVTLSAPDGKRTAQTRGGFLFTHRGYSGPAVLDISHLAVRSRAAGAGRQPIFVRWSDLAAEDWDRMLRDEAVAVGSLLRRHLPARLAEALCREAGLEPATGTAHLRREERRALVTALTQYSLPWTGDEGYKKAEVTGGGVALGEIDPHSMESRLHPGLFLCGEILDAFGPIGGHNFVWAWITARAAGTGAA